MTIHKNRKTNAGVYARQMRIVRRGTDVVVNPENGDIKRRAFAHLLMQYVYRLVWTLNLAGSVVVVVLFGMRLSATFGWQLGRMDYALLAVGGQLLATFFEQHLWKTGKTYTGSIRDRAGQFWRDLDGVDVAWIVCIGVLDALPTAWLVYRFLQSLALPIAIPYLFATLVAVAMAMLTEPAIKKHRHKAKTLLLEAGIKPKIVRLL